MEQSEKWIEGMSTWTNVRLRMSLYPVSRKCGEPVGVVCVKGFCHLDGGRKLLTKTPVSVKHPSSSSAKFNF